MLIKENCNIFINGNANFVDNIKYCNFKLWLISKNWIGVKDFEPWKYVKPRESLEGG